MKFIGYTRTYYTNVLACTMTITWSSFNFHFVNNFTDAYWKSKKSYVKSWSL